MGAYSPLPWAPAGLVDEVLRDVLQPTVDEMARRGTPFAGLLYAGLALTSRGVRVIEFNARFGDPETQVVLARLGTPLAGVLHAAATGRLAEVGALEWSEGAAVTVVVAAEGYPEAPVAGGVVHGLDLAGEVDGATCCTPGRRSARTATWWSPAAGCCRWWAPARPSRTPGWRRTRRWTGSRWPARTTAPTSPRPSSPTSGALVPVSALTAGRNSPLAT